MHYVILDTEGAQRASFDELASLYSWLLSTERDHSSVFPELFVQAMDPSGNLIGDLEEAPEFLAAFAPEKAAMKHVVMSREDLNEQPSVSVIGWIWAGLVGQRQRAKRQNPVVPGLAVNKETPLIWLPRLKPDGREIQGKGDAHGNDEGLVGEAADDKIYVSA